MKLPTLIEANLWAVLCGGLALYSGYITGQSDTRFQIEKLNDRITTLRKDLDRQTKIENCLTYHVTRLETGLKGDLPKCLDQ